jgi:hypothetical protein
MSEVVIKGIPGFKEYELYFDTDDIDEVNAFVDKVRIPTDDGTNQYEPGLAHLSITFKPGKRALWRLDEIREPASSHDVQPR